MDFILTFAMEIVSSIGIKKMLFIRLAFHILGSCYISAHRMWVKSHHKVDFYFNVSLPYLQWSECIWLGTLWFISVNRNENSSKINDENTQSQNLSILRCRRKYVCNDWLNQSANQLTWSPIDYWFFFFFYVSSLGWMADQTDWWLHWPGQLSVDW